MGSVGDFMDISCKFLIFSLAYCGIKWNHEGSRTNFAAIDLLRINSEDSNFYKYH